VESERKTPSMVPPCLPKYKEGKAAGGGESEQLGETFQNGNRVAKCSGEEKKEQGEGSWDAAL